MNSRPMPDLATRLAHLTDPAAQGVPDSELLRRFAEGRDEAAFELLVWRHGSMVLGTCRRVLGRSADADDAFQAAFLVLARKAASVRRGESLGGWLHRVALRAALRLRAAAGRRARVETQTLADPAAPAAHAAPPDDTAAVLDEEIGRLPDKLRVAFVLCELEGHTDAEAAEQLGCPKGTVLSRLSRARERLRVRLTQRGVTLAAIAALIARPAAVPAALLAAAVRGAAPFAARTPDAAVSAQAAALATGVLRSMTASMLKPVAAAIAVAVLAAGAVMAARDPKADPPPTAPRPIAAFPTPAPVPAAPPARNFKLAAADTGVSQVDEVRFSPDGKWGVTAGLRPGGGASAVVWDAATGKIVHTFTRPDGVGAAIEFSPDRKLFATSNPGDSSVTIWSVGTWNERATLAHELATDVGFSPDSRLVVTRSLAFGGMRAISEVKVWHTDTGKLAFANVPKGEETFASAAFAPDGKSLAVGTSDGSVRVLDVKTGKIRVEIATPGGKDVAAAFSPDGATLLAWPSAQPDTARGADVGTPRLWDAVTGKELRPLKGNEQPVRRAVFSADGKWAVAVGVRGAVWVWDTATGKKIAAVESTDAALDVRLALFSPEASVAALCGWESGGDPRKAVVVLYSLPAGKELGRLAGAKSVAFDRDGKTVAVVTGARHPQPGDDADEVAVRGLADLLKAKPSEKK